MPWCSFVNWLQLKKEKNYCVYFIPFMMMAFKIFYYLRYKGRNAEKWNANRIAFVLKGLPMAKMIFFCQRPKKLNATNLGVIQSNAFRSNWQKPIVQWATCSSLNQWSSEIHAVFFLLLNGREKRLVASIEWGLKNLIFIFAMLSPSKKGKK